MRLPESFIANIKSRSLFEAGDHLLLAVSGGVDSVVLCELCKQAGFSFSIAHCNFKLRGEESERDEIFVRRLAAKYGVEFLLKSFDTVLYAAEKKISIQEAARDLRYQWFQELVQTPRAVSPANPGTVLLTAHHADDNAETLLMNFFRGTGLRGLIGMPFRHDYIRRPLLEFSKQELVDFAKENNLSWVEDSSNLSSEYTRNFFRNEIIPAITAVFPSVQDNLQDNIRRFREIERLYQHAVNEIKKKLCKQKGDEVQIPIKQWMGYQNKALIYEIISDYGFGEKQVMEVIKLAEAESGRYIESPDHRYRIIRHRHWFIICPVSEKPADHIVIHEWDQEVRFAGGTISVSRMNGESIQPAKDQREAWLSLPEITFPIMLRKWETGDYFYPLGMRKKKKISRFFIDQKLSKTEKEKAWVLESGKRICWVAGFRIDDRFKITASVKSALVLRWQP